MKADIHLASKIAFRSHLLAIPAWLVLALIVGVLIAGQFSGRQPATVALDIGLSIIRLCLPLFIILLGQELFSREFERRLYLSSLTYPRTRSSWLLGRVVTIIILSVSLLLIMGLILSILVQFIGSGYKQATPVSLGLPYIITLIFFAIDMFVAIAITTLIAVSATSPSFVLLGTIGFILIARSYTPIIELLRDNPNVVSGFTDPHLYQDSLSLLAFILPDLGRLDVRMITLYGKMDFLPANWPLLAGATLAYISVLLGLAIWVLNKREFN